MRCTRPSTPLAGALPDACTRRPRASRGWIGLALLSMLAAATPGAAQETCVSLSSFQWTSIDTTIPADQWGDCTPDGLDKFEIQDGHTVEIAGHVEFSALGTTPRLSVLDGGTLIGHPPGRLTLGDKGIEALSGATLVARGRYHTFGVIPPAQEPLRDADNFWEVGAVVPCPDAQGLSDCASAPANVVRLVLPPSIESPIDGALLDGALAESLPEIVAGDSLCFFARDRSRVRDTPAEDGFCYEIVSVGSSAPGFHIDIDVRQGTEDPPGMPLARRDVQETSTLTALAAGDRCVDVPDGTITEDQLHASRWLRWDGESEAHRIALTLADVDCDGLDTGATTGSDSIRIADRRGFPAPIAAGTPVRIDYGFRPGDSFFVMRPFVIERAEALAEGDAPVHLDARIDVQAVVFRRVRGINLGGHGAPLGALEIDGWNDVWAIDSGDALLFRLFDESHVVLGHTTGTGGDLRPDKGTHGISVRGVTGLTLRDVALRYMGDDCLAVNQSGRPIAPMDVERFRCQFLSDGSVSASALDDSGTRERIAALRLRDVECADCSESHGLRFMGPADYDVDGYLAIGLDRARIGIGPDARFANVLAVGVTGHADQALLPEWIERCSVRDVVSLSEKFVGADHIDSCLFTDVGSASVAPLQPSTRETSIHNVALVRPFSTNPGCRDGSVGCSLVRWSLPVEGGETPRVERVSVVFDPGSGSDHRWISRDHGVNASANPGARLSGLLIAHHVHPVFAAESLRTSLADLDLSGGGFCFDGNASDGDAAALASLPPAWTSTGVPLGFVDPEADRWDVTPGSVADQLLCGTRRGADAPGQRGYRWIHAIAGIEPELLADDADGDGIPEDEAAPACAAGAIDGCSDNCLDLFNPLQGDADGDGIGDACEPACADGLDNDLDGAVDHPDDPGCRDATATREDPRCDDDVDNEGNGDGTDWDGGSGGDAPDPECVGRPWRNREAADCGLGVELLGALWLFRSRHRRRRRGDRSHRRAARSRVSHREFAPAG